ncbi:DUF6233 domain-containing protein [Streptomyces mexicanus]
MCCSCAAVWYTHTPRCVVRDIALRALAEGVEACGHCRPDSQLGFIDG